MNKVDLVTKVAVTAKITNAKAAAAVNAVFDSIAGSLRAGDKATLIGFGTFSVSDRKARTGRNPRTGASIRISARKVVQFKPGKALSELVNKKK